MSTTRTVADDPGAARTGLTAAIAAHAVWGLLPLYFLLLLPTGPFEIVAWRVVFSVALSAVLLTLTRGWPRFLAVVRSPKLLGGFAIAAVMIFINWQVFVLASVSGQVVEASLGYFVTPIVTVLLAVVFLGERLRPLQWTAVGVGAVAMIVLVVGHGSFPWIAVALAFSFGLYGLTKKKVAGAVDALTGFAMETMWLAIPAVVILLVIAAGPGLVFGSAGPVNVLLLIGAGPMTAIPLLLFATASRRLPLSLLGFVQYLTPIMQFVVGLAILHEQMTPERWLGFGLVWVALVILTVDLVRGARPRAVPITAEI